MWSLWVNTAKNPRMKTVEMAQLNLVRCAPGCVTLHDMCDSVRPCATMCETTAAVVRGVTGGVGMRTTEVPQRSRTVPNASSAVPHHINALANVSMRAQYRTTTSA